MMIINNAMMMLAVTAVATVGFSAMAADTAVKPRLMFGFDDSGTPNRIELNGENWGMDIDHSGLWRLELTNLKDGRKMAATAQTARHFSRKTLKGWEPQFTWSDFREPANEAVESVTVTVQWGRDMSERRWVLSMKLKPDWAAYYTMFPQFPMAGKLPGTDDRALCGADVSGVVHDPANTNLHPRVVLKCEQPSTMVAQFFCRYTDEHLFYTACEDGEGWDKTLVLRQMSNGGLCVYWGFSALLTGEAQLPYAVITGAELPKNGLPCDWTDAADRYKKWAVTQRWCKAPLLQRKDVPQFYKDAPIMFWHDRPQLEDPSLASGMFERLQREGLNDVPSLSVIFGWEKHWEWIGPDYFPMYPTEAGAKKLLDVIKSHNSRLFFWPSTYNYAIKVNTNKLKLDHSAEFEASGLVRAATVRRNGDWKTHPSWYGKDGYGATLCAAVPETREWFDNTALKPLAERGATVLQLDQFNMCSSIYAAECWNAAHGHPLRAGKWKTTANRANFAHQTELLKKYNPEGSMAFEGPNEHYADCVLVQDVRSCRFARGDWVNIYSYLYHEYVTPFQVNIIPDRFWLAYIAADGQMAQFPLQFCNGGKFDDEKTAAFLIAWAKLYRSAGRPYLAYGRHIRAPKITCREARLTGKDWRYKTPDRRIDIMKPVIFGGAYEAADGSRALCLANAMDTSEKCSFVWNGVCQELTLGPREIRLVTDSVADRNAASRGVFDRTIISGFCSTDGGRTWK